MTGIVASVFVGFNIGGSPTGIAWRPAVGAGILGKVAAATLMTFFVFLGGWTVGRNVMDTLAGDIITIEISLTAGVAVLFFIGLGILVANVFGVPVPTSMTTVGAIVGLGLATGTTNFETIGWIGSWWVVTPIIGFWVGATLGRYVYPELNRRYEIDTSEGPLFALDRSGDLPKPASGHQVRLDVDRRPVDVDNPRISVLRRVSGGRLSAVPGGDGLPGRELAIRLPPFTCPNRRLDPRRRSPRSVPRPGPRGGDDRPARRRRRPAPGPRRSAR